MVKEIKYLNFWFGTHENGSWVFSDYQVQWMMIFSYDFKYLPSKLLLQKLLVRAYGRLE